MLRLLLFVHLLLLTLPSVSQDAAFWLEGTVHGYEMETSRGLFKKNKTSVFEGTLEGVRLSLELEGEVVQESWTDEKGTYALPLEMNKLYTLVITKEGYNLNMLLLDTRALPLEVQQGGFHFLGAEFVLNSHKKGNDPDLNRSLGRLHYNPSRKQFNLAKTESDAQGAEGDPSYELLDKAIARNNDRIANYRPEQPPAMSEQSQAARTGGSIQNRGDERTPPKNAQRKGTGSSRSSISSQLDLGPKLTSEITDTSLLTFKQEALERAREQLAMDKLRQQTREDSLILLKRESQIHAAEQEIYNARLLIQTQQDKLQAQQNSLILLVIVLVLLTGFSLLVYFFYRNKKRNSLLLEQKNSQITDSINYAQRIQQTILVGERTLKSYLPDSFVLSEPRDIVSGDFYFFHPHANGYVLAVADCTGHGVPGAFMSLIGHRLLREIVAERNITNPAQILEQLDEGVQRALKGEKEGEILQDGMDISVCYIETQSRTITFAAAMNPAYLIQESSLQVLPADISSIGGKVLRSGRSRSFTNKAVPYEKGSMLYLFTDGFMDQFSESTDQKFNTRRFKEMILAMQSLASEDQKHEAYQTFKAWQGNVRQTDDILLMGIRLP